MLQHALRWKISSLRRFPPGVLDSRGTVRTTINHIVIPGGLVHCTRSNGFLTYTRSRDWHIDCNNTQLDIQVVSQRKWLTEGFSSQDLLQGFTSNVWSQNGTSSRVELVEPRIVWWKRLENISLWPSRPTLFLHLGIISRFLRNNQDRNH